MNDVSERNAREAATRAGAAVGSVAIVGAGLGGLVAGLALLQRGWSVRIYEQADVLGEVGAGLSVSRGTVSVFKALGILDEVRAKASPVGGLPFLHYKTGELLSGTYDRTDGISDTGPAPADAPFVARQIHRADLHAILVAAFTARAPGSLFLGHRLDEFEQVGGRARLRFSNGQSVEADLAIGADGVKSILRTRLWSATPARFTGQVAYRSLLPGNAVAAHMSAGRTAVYVGPRCVFNRYTLRGGTILNCVSLVSTPEWQGDGWSNKATAEDALAEHPGWHDDVRSLLAMSSPGTMIRWGLFDREPLPQWSDGPFTLLGDAAHPMLPFLGLGAAMAIEDGFILARALDGAGGLSANLQRYEAVRRPRTSLVAGLSRDQGALLQDQDPDCFDASRGNHANEALYGFDPVTAPF